MGLVARLMLKTGLADWPNANPTVKRINKAAPGIFIKRINRVNT
jgi:hypothetical protein